MSDSNRVKDRLLEFLQYNGLSQSKFEKKCGLANGYVNNIRRSISPDKLQLIALQFPNLNTGWLLTGEGEMLKGGTIQQAGDNATQVNGNANNVNNNHVLEMAMMEIAEQRRLVAKSQEQIDRLITLLENK